MKSILKSGWLAYFLCEYKWYRKYYGGNWAQTHIEEPCYSCMWLRIPDKATTDYREMNWRGTPRFEFYAKEIN